MAAAAGNDSQAPQVNIKIGMRKYGPSYLQMFAPHLAKNR